MRGMVASCVLTQLSRVLGAHERANESTSPRRKGVRKTDDARQHGTSSARRETARDKMCAKHNRTTDPVKMVKTHLRRIPAS